MLTTDLMSGIAPKSHKENNNIDFDEGTRSAHIRCFQRTTCITLLWPGPTGRNPEHTREITYHVWPVNTLGSQRNHWRRGLSWAEGMLPHWPGPSVSRGSEWADGGIGQSICSKASAGRFRMLIIFQWGKQKQKTQTNKANKWLSLICLFLCTF